MSANNSDSSDISAFVFYHKLDGTSTMLQNNEVFCDFVANTSKSTVLFNVGLKYDVDVSSQFDDKSELKTMYLSKFANHTRNGVAETWTRTKLFDFESNKRVDDDFKKTVNAFAKLIFSNFEDVGVVLSDEKKTTLKNKTFHFDGSNTQYSFNIKEISRDFAISQFKIGNNDESHRLRILFFDTQHVLKDAAVSKLDDWAAGFETAYPREQRDIMLKWMVLSYVLKSVYESPLFKIEEPRFQRADYEVYKKIIVESTFKLLYLIFGTM